MINAYSIDELAQRLAALLPPDFARTKAEMTATFRDALQAGLRKLDLVTREEFDVQRSVLARTREKLEALERQLLALEQSLGQTQAKP
ncbi:MAG: accessory factor UbiK family protein [Rhodanobacter sp.]|jgi:BMFP domain-containing protein YqiC|nr:accessory factor UbiK family protein [Rhodanobacter sp.]